MITYDLNNKDRYGFYTVGERKTYSKIEALEYHAVSKKPVVWHYNTDVYGQFNWSVEPPGSLDSWYTARALQIREQYDYLVLWYSGGADSANILNTFIKNNIFIDEIAQYATLDGPESKDSYQNKEVFATSIPKTKKLIENNPVYKNTVHRVVDVGTLMQQVMTNNDNKWDFFYRVNQYYSINSLSRTQMRETVPEYKKLIESGKKVCFIWGIEKPDVSVKDNQFYIHFRDGQDHGVTAHAQMLNRPWEYDEFFYWAPNMPQLPAKQGHVLRRYLDQLSDADVDGVHVLAGKPKKDDIYGTHCADPFLTNPRFTVKNNGKYFSISLRGVHRLIYPDWEPDLVVAGKPHGHLFNPKDAWLFKDNAPDRGQQYYSRGVASLRQHVKNIDATLWFEHKFDPKKSPYIGYVLPFQNSYCLGNSIHN